MTAPVKQAIDWLERGNVVEALAALRKPPEVATEEEICKALGGHMRPSELSTHYSGEYHGFRAGEQFARRKILGE